ncbi:MAG: MarR family transcriptional regulator [Rhodospirillales bacterium]
MTAKSEAESRRGGYRLDRQVGFLLRKANQRHLSIFKTAMSDLTPRQFASLAMLWQMGPVSQNALGRATAMDAATIKGVIDRLQSRDLVTATPDPQDRRRLTVALTAAGQALFQDRVEEARSVTRRTLTPLSADEQEQFLALLKRLT